MIAARPPGTPGGRNFYQEESFMKFGCCIPTKDYETAAAAGFDFVELPGTELADMEESAFARLCDVIASGPIPCLALNCYCDARLPIVGSVPQDRDIQCYAHQVFRRASRLGIQMAGIGSPGARRLPPDFDRSLVDAQGRHFLLLTAQIAAEYGIRLNFEQMHRFSCQYGVTTPEAARIVRSVGRPELGLVADFYHRGVMGEPPDAFPGYADLIRHTHISTCGPHYERGYPGMEDLPQYTKILQGLQSIGYCGAMSIEAPAEELASKGRAALDMLHLAEKII